MTRVKRLFELSRKAYLDLACSRIAFAAGATVSAALADPGSKLAEQDVQMFEQLCLHWSSWALEQRVLGELWGHFSNVSPIP